MTLFVLPKQTPRGRILRDEDLIGLYRNIDMALPDQKSRIVQFISCYPGEGTATIGKELAMLAAQTLACDALLIDVKKTPFAANDAEPRPAASLLDVLHGQSTVEDALIESAAGSLWKAALTSDRDMESVLPHIERLKEILSALRTRFKLIILNTPGALVDPTAVALGELCDAAVLVVEAEHTRAPAAKQALQAIDKAGTKVIGIAFNKRRYHIPEQLYRFL